MIIHYRKKTYLNRILKTVVSGFIQKNSMHFIRTGFIISFTISENILRMVFTFFIHQVSVQNSENNIRFSGNYIAESATGASGNPVFSRAYDS
jgi:hypothetical protein